MKLLTALFLLIAVSVFGAVPSYTVFRGTGGILITSNPPTGNITIDGSGIFTSSGTNATLSIATNGVPVLNNATQANFIMGTNVVFTATNIGSVAHIGIHAVGGQSSSMILSNLIGTVGRNVTNVISLSTSNATSKPITNSYANGILTLFGLEGGSGVTVTPNGSNLVISSSASAVAPPISSVQFNSNGVMQGSAGFIYTNGQVRVADVVIAGQGMEVTAGSFVLNGGDSALVAWNGLGRMRWPTGGVARLEDEFGSFNRLQLGGDTAAFPAIGRTNGDVIILGANGAFKLGGATNRLIAPAVHIANDGGMGTPLLSLENPLNGLKWDLEINSHAETYLLGLGFNDSTYAMVVELDGNVGIGITNPTVRLDVQGRFMARSNVYFPNISSNATPVAFLVTDSDGQVYEAAVPTGGGSSSETNSVLTNLVGTVANNVTNVVSLSTSNATSKPITNSYAAGVLTLFGLEAGANVTVTPNGSNLVIAATAGSSSSDTNAVLTNMVGTVGRNVTNVVSLSTSNATSKPLTNSYTAGVLTVFGLEGGSGVTVTPNGSNLVISSSASAVAPPISSVQFNSNGVMQGNANFVYTNGLVGLGTNTPTNLLHLRSLAAGQIYFRLDDTNGTPRVRFGNYPTASGFGALWMGDVAATAGNCLMFSDGSSCYFNGPSSLEFSTAGAVKWSMSASGAITPSTSNLYDIGSVALPGRTLHLGAGLYLADVTASRIATWHTDKTLTNGATTVTLLDNFFAMGISNIVAADSGLVIRTNAGVLTISNTVAAAGGTTVSGSTGQIAFINVAGTGLTNANGAEAGAVNRPGFGYFPQGPHGGFGGLMVFANLPMGLLTVGHPNVASDFETFATAMVLSNRYNGTGFKQELSKFEGVDVGAGSDPSSTLSTWATWSGTTRTIAAEIRKDGMGFFSHGTMYPSNSLASTMPTAAELGPGGYWVGNSNASLVTVYSLNGSSTAMKVLAP